MHIVSITEKPIASLPYQQAVSGGGIAWSELPILLGSVRELPDGIDALVVASDLQGRVRDWEQGCVGELLGDALADELPRIAEEVGLPHMERTGAVLAGDLYAKPELHGRGGSGDVRSVWDAFSCICRWVVGVAGNHDVFGPGWSVRHLKEFKDRTDVHLLEEDSVTLDGLRIAGLSGIIGPPRKPFRRTEEDFVSAVARLAATAPDVLVMHDGPDVESGDYRGHPSVREALESAPPTLIVRGHAHWTEPLHELRNGSQILNVDSRVVILRALHSRGPAPR